MDGAWLDSVRARHGDVLREVDRLAAAGSGADLLGPALQAFLAFERTELRPLLLEEEHTLGPLLERFLPAEVGGVETLRREHDTVRALLDALREAAPAVPGSADARADVQVLAADLALLLHHHVRREDSLLHPLLRQLEAGRA